MKYLNVLAGGRLPSSVSRAVRPAAVCSPSLYHHSRSSGRDQDVITSQFQTSLRQFSSHSLPTEDISCAIIGGGAMGASLAYHLAEAGMKNVVLFEKTDLTAGSTWHAAGLTTYYNGGVRAKRIHYDSIQLFNRLQSQMGQEIGFHRCGSLRLCETPLRVDEARHQMARQGWNKAPQRLIFDREELRRLHPLLNLDLVLAGLYNPGDGHMDPYSMTQALATVARRNGAVIKEHCPVLGARLRPSDGLWEIDTKDGTVRAKHVVNAAGTWARDVGLEHGMDLPICSVHHQYVMTGPIDEVKALEREIPVIRDLEGSYYLRQERDGLLFGPYESSETMHLCEDWFLNGVAKGFGRELFESDLDRLMPHVEKAMEMVPAVKKGEIQRSVSGPITYTPDLQPLVGPFLNVPNYWLANGLAYGIIACGGVGKFLSQWILTGEKPYELIELDPNRYSHWTSKSYVLTKCRETYGMNNAHVYPKEERFGGRPTARISGIYDELLSRGAEMGFHAGWEQPNWFALVDEGDEAGYKPSFRRTNWFKPVGRECHLVLNKVGIIDLSPFGKFEIEGRDAVKLIDHLCANLVPKVGGTNISHMLTKSGRVYSELTVTRLDEDKIFCITGSGSELHDLRYIMESIRRYKYDVSVRNVTDSMSCLGVAGPFSRQVLQTITDTDMSHKAFPFLKTRNMTINNIPVLAMRISYTGELGWELYHDKKWTKQLYLSLLEAGRPHNIGDFGTYALNSLRLEKGFRAWGSEMSGDNNPFEAGLDFFIKMNKKCDFVGKEALGRIQSSGLSRQLMFLFVDTGEDEVDVENDQTIWFGDTVVGSTTSGAYGYQVKSNIAYGYLPKDFDQAEMSVEVEILGKRYPATLHKRAPVDIEILRNKKPTPPPSPAKT